MKKLSLSLLPAAPVPHRLAEPQTPVLSPSRPARPRRPSVISLPVATNPTASLLHRKEEDGGLEVAPYTDGPIQVIPGIWIGSEDNARDWKGLLERGIKSILNVAKEVSSPFDSLQQSSHALRPAMSTPDFRTRPLAPEDPTFYPGHPSSGRPAMHYLKLQWSHGQQNLVDDGFKDGMAFADAALQRGDGCLIQYVKCILTGSLSLTLFSSQVASAAFQDLQQWSLPSSCVLLQSATHMCPPRCGRCQVCKVHMPL